jgi:hypothetical protein
MIAPRELGSVSDLQLADIAPLEAVKPSEFEMFSTRTVNFVG